MSNFVRLAPIGVLLCATAAALASPTVPTDIEQPGTQPGEVSGFTSPDNCDNCHGGLTQPVNPGTEPEREPAFGWRGGMMANATRDPLFWATLAVAEQDFLPDADPDRRGGAGDLCIRCHSVGGWINGHSTPTDGSALSNSETDGVECEFCHLLVDPDPPVNVAGTTEVQNAPFQAYDPVTGEAYRGSGQYVLNGNGTRLGPYSNANAKHAFLPSPFHRQAELCGTCHDVSNPAVGDLAHDNGAQVPLAAGTFSGVPGTPVDGKAAFNNPPYRYGIVERTSSEWTASAFPALRVNDFGTLPDDLRDPAGSLAIAYHRAYDARGTANYEDGATRYFTCQTCHMAASTGIGCDKPGTPTRTDLPRHDQTGSGYWTPDLVKFMDTRGTLRLGGGLSATQRSALDAGKVRAADHIRSAAGLSAAQDGSSLVVRVTNRTGHKLISGYPEGRRMWLNLEWYDASDALLREDGAYGPIGRSVNDLDGVPHAIESILDLDDAVIYEAKPGMDQAWAAQLLGLGYDSGLVLEYDRDTDAPEHTLGELAAATPGTAFHTFHFVLNNVVTSDDRIPPYGFRYDDARVRNTLPVPATQFGDPGPGGTYLYWDERALPIPSGAARVEVRLYYQQTSWEYVQFLWLANDGANTFLANEGANLLDGWLNTGMSPPLEMALASTTLTPVASGVPGNASPQDVPAEQMRASWNPGTGLIDVTYTPACDATGHTIYYGDLANVATYTYAGAACGEGASGSASFDPGGLASAFFLIVGENGTEEGSYGRDGAGLERPESVGTAACDRPQDLAGVVCE